MERSRGSGGGSRPWVSRTIVSLRASSLAASASSKLGRMSWWLRPRVSSANSLGSAGPGRRHRGVALREVVGLREREAEVVVDDHGSGPLVARDLEGLQRRVEVSLQVVDCAESEGDGAVLGLEAQPLAVGPGRGVELPVLAVQVAQASGSTPAQPRTPRPAPPGCRPPAGRSARRRGPGLPARWRWARG